MSEPTSTTLRRLMAAVDRMVEVILDLQRRSVRTETRLSKLMEHVGLSADGRTTTKERP